MTEGPLFSRRSVATGAGLGAALAATSVRASEAAFEEHDRSAVIDLFSAFCWTFDCTDEGAFLDLFTDDAIVIGMGVAHAGKPAIAKWFRYLIAMRGDDDWLHQAGQFRFEARGDRCTAYAYATHFSSNPQTKARSVRSLGSFVGECVRTAGQWRFRRFSVAPWDKGRLPWKKPLPWDADI